MDLSPIRWLMLDVDGVLTDGRLMSLPDRSEVKAFHVRDGCAIKLWQKCGGQVVILSGRRSPAVTERAAELGIAWVRMGVSDKLSAYDEMLKDAALSDNAVAYVGDDLPDLGPMRRCGFAVAVADAAPTVKRAARFVTRRGGGRGAVAEAVEWILRKQRRWTSSLYATI